MFGFDFRFTPKSILIGFLICSLIANYFVVFIIMWVDITDRPKLDRYEDCQFINTKKKFWLMFVPYYLLLSGFLEALRIFIDDFKDFYKKLK